MVDDSIEVLVIKKPKLKIQSNSNAYYRDLLPITQMIKDFSALKLDSQTQTTVNAIDFVDKFGTTLDSLSAYYDIEGDSDNLDLSFDKRIDYLFDEQDNEVIKSPMLIVIILLT
ncbi:hypothetical protein [Leuconostoc citreum]|uniref:hypothetical protein n=1 Tax=Leuconostoc citreum TaxID=33964 RepID=UPI003D7FD590